MRTLLLGLLIVLNSFASDECKLLLFQSVNEIQATGKMIDQSFAMFVARIDAPAADYCLLSRERRRFEEHIADRLRQTVVALELAKNECPTEEVAGVMELLETAKSKLREVDHTHEDELMSVDECTTKCVADHCK